VYYPDDEIEEFLENDTRFSETSRVYRIGSVRPEGEGQDKSADIGYFENDLAVEMFHLELLEGRYPENEGEICVDKTTMQAWGYSAATGSKIDIEIFDEDGSVISSGEYTVVGVLQIITQGAYSASYSRQNEDRYGNVYYPPLMYLSAKEGQSLSADVDIDRIFLGNVEYTDSFDDYDMLYELNTKFDSIICSDINYNFSRSQIAAAITMGDNAIERDGIGYLANEQYMDSELVEKDFYNGVLIPLFFILFIILTVCSVYSVFRLSLSRRNEQLAILRSIGMNLKQMITMLLAELCVLIVVCIGSGYILGIGIYSLNLKLQEIIFNQKIFWGFTLNGFWGEYISKVTHNPYILPWVIVVISTFMVYFYFICSNLQGDIINVFCRKNISKKRKFRKIGSSLTGGVHAGMFIIMTMVITAVAFGFLSCKREAIDNETEFQDKLDNIGTDQFQYVAQLNVNETLLGYNQMLHNSGITPEQTENIVNDSNVEEYMAYMLNLSSKVVLKEDDDRNEILAQGSNRFVRSGEYTEEENDYYEKADKADWSYKGYSDDENIYQAPLYGFEKSGLDIFAPYIVSGELNTARIEAGEEVILLVDNETYLEYFAVGDALPMSDVVFSEEIDGDENVQQGIPPEGMDVTTFIDGREFYAIGKRADFSVTIGAIAIIDASMSEILHTDYPVPESGIRVVTTIDAVEGFGLPDRNITNLYVNLKKDGNVIDFENIWYSNLANTENVNVFCLKDLYKAIISGENASMLIFYALFALLIVISSVCIYNIVTVQMVNARGKIAIVRAIGGTKKKISGMILARQVVYPLISGISSSVIMAIYIPIQDLSNLHPYIFVVLVTTLLAAVTYVISDIQLRKELNKPVLGEIGRM
jgi:ABC-type lipoprotein release transport system permease subunit